MKIPELFGEQTRRTDIDVDTNFYLISKEDNTKTEQVTLPHAYLDQIGSEIKLLIGCTEEEINTVYEFHNSTEYMKGLLIKREV